MLSSVTALTIKLFGTTYCMVREGQFTSLKGHKSNRPRVRVRISDRVRNRDKLHLWLWWPLAMAAPDYVGPWL